VHPAARMPDSGVTLCSLALCGVPAAARELLQLRRVQVNGGIGPAISATLATPRGDVILETA